VPIKVGGTTLHIKLNDTGMSIVRGSRFNNNICIVGADDSWAVLADAMINGDAFFLGKYTTIEEEPP